MKKEICMSGMEQVIRNGMGHWRKRRDSLDSDHVCERRMEGSIKDLLKELKSSFISVSGEMLYDSYASILTGIDICYDCTAHFLRTSAIVAGFFGEFCCDPLMQSYLCILEYTYIYW
ncbi:hypothetical protein VNO80_14533 [Phaseolus coccineus]|uniref:Uncharacterized protein n=1 Tax=Phaseolus coccineus TaxID=3886 RepID=A0AAN9QYH7_PHACN